MRSVERLGGIALAFSQFIAGEAPADDHPVKHLRDSLPTHTQRLNDEIYEVRERAQHTLIESTEKALNVRNPLPSDILDALDPQKPGLSPEQRERLKIVRERIHECQLLEPGRIASPRESGTPLRELLEAHFGMPIVTSDPSLEALVKNCMEGEDGQTAMQALKQLCDYGWCIPELRNGSILLRPAPACSEVRVHGNLCSVTQQTETGPRSVVFYTPKGVILNVSSWAPFSATSTVCSETTVPWTSLEFAHDPKFRIPNQETFSAYVGIAPETHTVDVEKFARIIIGPQIMSITGIEENNGEHVVQIGGSICEEDYFAKIPIDEYTYLYQLIAANRATVWDDAGKEIPCSIKHLVIEKGEFHFEIHVRGKPHRLSMYGYNHAIDMTLQLP